LRKIVKELEKLFCRIFIFTFVLILIIHKFHIYNRKKIGILQYLEIRLQKKQQEIHGQLAQSIDVQ